MSELWDVTSSLSVFIHPQINKEIIHLDILLQKIASYRDPELEVQSLQTDCSPAVTQAQTLRIIQPQGQSLVNTCFSFNAEWPTGRMENFETCDMMHNCGLASIQSKSLGQTDCCCPASLMGPVTQCSAKCVHQ